MELGETKIPQGTKKTDPYLGEVEIYEKSVQISTVTRQKLDEFYVGVKFQGCATDRFCYPPDITWFKVGRGWSMELPKKPELN